MAEPTLQQVFGENATQNSSSLTIYKSDLSGLTASDANTAESLFVALLLKSSGYLNENNQTSNIDIQVTITPSQPSLITRNNRLYRQSTFTVELQKEESNGGVSANDY